MHATSRRRFLSSAAALAGTAFAPENRLGKAEKESTPGIASIG